MGRWAYRMGPPEVGREGVGGVGRRPHVWVGFFGLRGGEARGAAVKVNIQGGTTRAVEHV